MELVLIVGHAEDHPDLAALRALLKGYTFTEAAYGFGSIARVPCIAAVAADGRAVYSGGVELTQKNIAAWAAEAAPAPVTTPVVFLGAEWKEYAYGVLGTIAAPGGTPTEKGMAGIRRYGAILKGARASTDNGVIAALDQYDDTQRFRKDKVEIFLGLLHADNKIVTDEELVAIIGGWPT